MVCPTRRRRPHSSHVPYNPYNSRGQCTRAIYSGLMLSRCVILKLFFLFLNLYFLIIMYYINISNLVCKKQCLINNESQVTWIKNIIIIIKLVLPPAWHSSITIDWMEGRFYRIIVFLLSLMYVIVIYIISILVQILQEVRLNPSLYINYCNKR